MQQKKIELINSRKHTFENAETNSELNPLKRSLKSSDEKNVVLMKENVRLKNEVQRLTLDLSRLTKGKEILDKLLGK